MKTKTEMNPPNAPPDKEVGSGFKDDKIREIGDRIAAMQIKERNDLAEYIKNDIT